VQWVRGSTSQDVQNGNIKQLVVELVSALYKANYLNKTLPPYQNHVHFGNLQRVSNGGANRDMTPVQINDTSKPTGMVLLEIVTEITYVRLKK
jgi:hypothetical protein